MTGCRDGSTPMPGKDDLEAGLFSRGRCVQEEGVVEVVGVVFTAGQGRPGGGVVFERPMKPGRGRAVFDRYG